MFYTAKRHISKSKKAHIKNHTAQVTIKMHTQNKKPHNTPYGIIARYTNNPMYYIL